jgi:putative FmdB family regulatory protein
VPTYEYECNKCRRVFEVRQRISEPALTTHEGCGGKVHRLISPAPFILKGEGWYVTDYPSEARKKAKEAEKPAAAEKTSTTTPAAPASSPAPKTD